MAADAWPAPAKLNLMLRIVGRRDDGYHRLQTVYQFIDLVDDVYIRLRDDGQIRRSQALADIAESEDLSLRAAFLLQQATACRLGADIRIVKRIPLGGGLGGGSSDAATTLVALNHLWGCGLASDDLQVLGLQLGADVPVFVQGLAAWAEGIGEILTPIEPPTPVYVLLVPDLHISTREIFQAPDLPRQSPPITPDAFENDRQGNDCLAVVRARHPRFAEVFDWLNQRLTARLTGTGACIFAACAGRAEAEAILRVLPAGVTGFAVQGLNRSPLLARVAGAGRSRMGIRHG